MRECPACFHQNPDNATACEKCQYPFDTGFESEKTKIAPAEITGISEGRLIASRYRVVRELGRGGMGVVYLAQDIELRGRQVAVKMIHPNLVAHPEALQRFEDEVIISQELTHSSIIRVHDLKRWQGLRFFTMEYVEGRSLREWIIERKDKKPPFTVSEVVSVIDPLLKALSYAHQHTIHRDIKPENIMVIGEFPDVQIKVLDFGIAKTLSPSRFTHTAHAMGTAYYMAPEQMQGMKDIDQRADLYAVGMILYEMLTGAMAVGRFRLPGELYKELPGELDEVVEKALAPLPQDRFKDAKEMRTSLQSVLASSEAQEKRQKEEERERQERTRKELEEKEKEAAERQRQAEAERRRVEQERAAEAARVEAERRRSEETRKAEEARLESERKKEEQRKLEEERRREAEERAAKEEAERKALQQKAQRKKAIGVIVAVCIVAVLGVVIYQWQKGKPVEKAEIAPPSERVQVTTAPSKPDEKPSPAKGRLVVAAEPESAKIRILNISPAYQRGMELDPGRYHVEVSANGYETWDEWVVVDGGEEKRVNVELKAVSAASGEDKAKTFTVNGVSFKMVRIPAGEFLMGSPSSEPGRDNDEGPQHRVRLSRDFWMGQTEVTQGLWKAVMGSNPSKFSDCGNDCPVEMISWEECQEFIRKLNGMVSGGNFGLPTEAEWEYGCRAGTTGPFNTGRCLNADQANYNGNNPYAGCGKGQNRDRTIKVGSFAPNAWGLYDMHGNVWEWCQDWYGDYPSGAVTDPGGPSGGSYRVNRGGSWDGRARYCRSASRGHGPPASRGGYLGLRLARTL